MAKTRSKCCNTLATTTALRTVWELVNHAALASKSRAVWLHPCTRTCAGLHHALHALQTIPLQQRWHSVMTRRGGGQLGGGLCGKGALQLQPRQAEPRFT